MAYEQEVIEKLKATYGSYNAWQSIVNIMTTHPTPDTREMGETALDELADMQKRIKELEAKAAKWDMIESAIENEVMFVDTHNDSINGHQTLTKNDLEYLAKKLGKA